MSAKHSTSQVKYEVLGLKALAAAGGMEKYLVDQADAGYHLNGFAVDGSMFHFVFFTVDHPKK